MLTVAYALSNFFGGDVCYSQTVEIEVNHILQEEYDYSHVQNEGLDESFYVPRHESDEVYISFSSIKKAMDYIKKVGLQELKDKNIQTNRIFVHTALGEESNYTVIYNLTDKTYIISK